MSDQLITFTFNGDPEPVKFYGDPETPLLWVIRDIFGKTGTKFGCGMAMCGACTVHLNGVAIRSCVKKVQEVAGQEITTIEAQDPTLQTVQQAWIAESVPQCGYCQPGQIMAATALLKAKASPTDADIDVAMAGNLCRCGTYPRIRRAIHRAAGELSR